MRNQRLDAQEVGVQQKEMLASEHRGMPAKDPQVQQDLVDKQITQRDASAEASLHLPHERDQSTSMTATGRAPLIEQAFRDEAQGRQDTSKEPEMLAAYDKQKPEAEALTQSRQHGRNTPENKP